MGQLRKLSPRYDFVLETECSLYHGCRLADAAAGYMGIRGADFMKRIKATAAAGRTVSDGAPKTFKPKPVSAPLTTRRDIEQSTYTALRSKQLREGNVASL
jgi:hypothetical protein